MENKMPELKIKFPIILIIGATSLIFGFLYNYFFNGKSIGVSFPMYVILTIASILFVSLLTKRKIPKTIAIPAIASLFFSGMVAVRASEILTILNVFATLVLLTAILQMLRQEKLRNYTILNYIETGLKFPFEVFVQSWNFLSNLFQLRKLLKGHEYTGQIFKGFFMAAPIIILFLALFSSADLVFDKYLSRLLTFDISGNNLHQTILVLVISYIFGGIFYYATQAENTDGKRSENPDGIEIEMNAKAGNLEISTFLVLINILFLAFISIQFIYLFGGENNISLEGFTYSEYARKGFFELNMVAVISFLIILLAEKAISKKRPTHPLSFKILCGALIFQIIIMMVSAFKRLSIYENIYGYTELRLYSHMFTVWIGSIFVLLLYKIVIDKRKNIFAFNSFVMSFLFLFGLNILNPHAFIAQQNIDLYKKNQRLDLYYLSSLSVDATPEIAKVLSTPTSDSKLKEMIDSFEQEQYKRLHEEYFQEIEKNWQSWNLAKIEAKKSFENSRKINQTFLILNS